VHLYLSECKCVWWVPGDALLWFTNLENKKHMK
jgi:hypothetical protein